MKRLLALLALTTCFGCAVDEVDENSTNDQDELASGGTSGPLVVYQNGLVNRSAGASATISTTNVVSGGEIPAGLNNKITSFKLNKGYQVVFADAADGTGISGTWIAATSAIDVNLPARLNEKVSFIRVLPYKNHDKKGLCTGGHQDVEKIDNGWYYNWGSQPSHDASGNPVHAGSFAPMSWGGYNSTATGLDKSAGTLPLLLTFNEPDNAGQSNLSVSTALTRYTNLLSVGLRMGSPVVTQGPTGNKWLLDFMQQARDSSLRVDFVNVHWYDWGAWSSDKDRASNPQSIFNRFKHDMTVFHDTYGLPIRITEFNANPNRYTYIQEQFLKVAVPWLEQQDWIEGYAFFQPSATFDDSSGNPHTIYSHFLSPDNSTVTTLGAAYSSLASAPHLTENKMGGSNETLPRP